MEAEQNDYREEDEVLNESSEAISEEGSVTPVAA